MLLVTGAAGFIGSNFVLDWLDAGRDAVVGLDKLTYAGNLHNLEKYTDDPRFIFVKGDIGDRDLLSRVLARYKPRAIINFAAESHVDRSIHGADAFIETNVVGTYHLLETTRLYWNELQGAAKEAFRFVHVSTDEVYGSLEPQDPAFTETTPYAPNSPYAASKASSDHLVRAQFHTYGLPTLTTNCSNNYGAYQFPEKLIPLMIHHALTGRELPIYGDGLNVRDWLYVTDHCAALACVLEKGKVGETYNIGGRNEKTNIDIVMRICDLLDRLRPRADGESYATQIVYVKDRLGHDRRYAVNSSKIALDLGWEPRETFETGLEKTVRWYLDHPEWVENVTSGAYRNWLQTHYAQENQKVGT